MIGPDARQSSRWIDLLASRDSTVIVGEAKTIPSLGTRNQRASKAKKLVMVAQVLHADQILLCTSAADNCEKSTLRR
jgi:hypothetical protein